jgi:hypothetical protein
MFMIILIIVKLIIFISMTRRTEDSDRVRLIGVAACRASFIGLFDIRNLKLRALESSNCLGSSEMQGAKYRGVVLLGLRSRSSPFSRMSLSEQIGVLPGVSFMVQSDDRNNLYKTRTDLVLPLSQRIEVTDRRPSLRLGLTKEASVLWPLLHSLNRQTELHAKKKHQSLSSSRFTSFR